MRQAGVIAAAALHALEHHVERLADDHANAQILARAVEETPGLSLESARVETNLVWVRVDPTLGTARRSPPGSGPRGSSSAPWARRCSGPAPISTSPARTSSRAADVFRKVRGRAILIGVASLAEIR